MNAATKLSDSPSTGQMGAMFRLARPHQWTKNALVLAALVFGQRLFVLHDVVLAVVALVAFSGEVNDTDSGPDPFTENSTTLNSNLKGRDIREAFKGDEYQILLVANKFQTGFDQPLLCGMYVDKRLAGIQLRRI